MTQTLQQLTSDRRARLLARIAERYLPNPGIDPPSEISPEDAAIQERILKEIKAHLRITSEEEPDAQKALINYLSEGMSRAVLENADLKAIEYRLGQRGELPISSYKVKFGDNLKKSGVTTKRARDAIYNADEIQHLHYSEPEQPDRDLSLFLKHQISPGQDSYTLLVIGMREGSVINVDVALRIYHLEVNLSNAHSPMDYMQAFVEVYGLEIQVGDQHGKFITDVFVPKKLLSGKTGFLRFKAFQKITATYSFFKRTEGLVRRGFEVGVAFVIDISKYQRDLRKHGVKVPKSR